jgi:hypothetical protein
MNPHLSIYNKIVKWACRGTRASIGGAPTHPCRLLRSYSGFGAVIFHYDNASSQDKGATGIRQPTTYEWSADVCSSRLADSLRTLSQQPLLTRFGHKRLKTFAAQNRCSSYC